MYQKDFSFPALAIVALALAVFLSIQPIAVQAEDRPADNFVYVMTNKGPNNSILQFRRDNNGSLAFVREVVTGGRGTGPTVVDPLGSQDSLVLSSDGQLLFAANAGSNQISVLTTMMGKLVLLSQASSGGDFPNSIAVSGDLVYVLNAKGGTPKITGFRLAASGRLESVATVDLPPGTVGANDIRFSRDGTELLVTVSGANEILLFPVGDDGVAASPVIQPSAGHSPFGIRFGLDGTVLVSEAAGSISSYRLSNGMLDVVSAAVPDTQKASCWITVTRSGGLAYVSNTGSGTISSYAVNSGGQVSLLRALAATTGGAPIDSSLSRDNRFFYVLDSANGRILFYAANGSSLTALGQISSLPTSIQGVAAQ